MSGRRQAGNVLTAQRPEKARGHGIWKPDNKPYEQSLKPPCKTRLKSKKSSHVKK